MSTRSVRRTPCSWVSSCSVSIIDAARMTAVRTIRVVAAVIEHGGRYLITQRRASAVLPLLWEFPGGRVEEGESDATALKREVRHRLGVDIQSGKLISFVSHPYEHYVV